MVVMPPAAAARLPLQKSSTQAGAPGGQGRGEVDVGIDAAGKDEESRGVDLACAPQPGAHRRHLPVTNPDVSRGFAISGNHCPVLDDQVKPLERHRRFLHSHHCAT